MTIKIEIEVPSDLVLKGAGSDYLDRAASALGWSRGVSSVAVAAATPMTTEQVRKLDDAPAVQTAAETASGDEAPTQTVSLAEPEQTEAPAAEIDTRLVGEPAKGNKRRNSAEKAEDDEFEKLAAAKGIPLGTLNGVVAKYGRVRAAEELERAAGKPAEPVTIASMKMLPDDATAEDVAREFAAISTGEERIGPEDEQDAADEAAETAKTGLAAIDVLRRLVGDYQKKHGMPKAVALCQEGGLIGKGIHELDDAGIEAAISAMKLSLSSPDEAAKVEEKAAPAPAPKSKADLVEAMMRYGDKFDGTRDQAKMTHTLADCPRIFAEVFGPDVTKLSQVPEDGFGKAVAAIEQAIATDPFGRAK